MRYGLLGSDPVNFIAHDRVHIAALPKQGVRDLDAGANTTVFRRITKGRSQIVGIDGRTSQ